MRSDQVLRSNHSDPRVGHSGRRPTAVAADIQKRSGRSRAGTPAWLLCRRRMSGTDNNLVHRVPLAHRSKAIAWKSGVEPLDAYRANASCGTSFILAVGSSKIRFRGLTHFVGAPSLRAGQTEANPMLSGGRERSSHPDSSRRSSEDRHKTQETIRSPTKTELFGATYS